MIAAARLGRYELVGRLATGGMAEILLARVVGPEGFVRAVVVKRILDHLATREDFRAMFLDEARIVSRIHHDNVVQVHELGEEDGQLYLVMDYLEGESAAGLLRRLVKAGERLPPALAAHVVAEAATGLHAAHELVDEHGEPLGLVHRDASPQNLFITYDGAVKVLDFGIAHAAGRATETQAGQIKGKFSFMSPEQCRGKELDRRSDVFALGAVLYELSTGRRLFARDNEMATMRAVCRDPLHPPSAFVEGYPEALERVCLRALERPRASRYPTAAEMARDLREAIRELSEGEPRQELAALMQRLFADRVERKAATLRNLRQGKGELVVSEGEVDQGVTIPTVANAELAEETRSTTTTSLTAEEAPRRSAWIPLLLALVALGSLGAFVYRRAQVEPTAATSASAPEEIAIRIDSDPAGAEVWLDGEDLGPTPLTHHRPRAAASGQLVLRREGQVAHEETVSFELSQRIHVTLTPTPAASAATSASTAPPPPLPPPLPPSMPAPAPKPAPKGIYKL